MKHPSLWKTADLHLHLQHALELELWTVPLYLTALYSIKGLRNLRPHDYPDAAKLLYSVAAQEMLHIELVCNISNALGWSPKFYPPVYGETKGVPFIHPSKSYLPDILHGYIAKPQALNINSLKLFCSIELPHPKSEFVFEQERSYYSIADMYEALKIGIDELWDKCYIGDARNTRQKYSFREYHNTDGRHHGFSQVINSRAAALKAMEAIVEQGEGANSLRVPVDYRPPEIGEETEHDAGWYKGNLSHYQKFKSLLHHNHKIPPVYEITRSDGNIPEQQKMRSAFTDLLHEMQRTFTEEGDEMSIPFWEKMYAFAHSIMDVWEAGVCPDFDL